MSLKKAVDITVGMELTDKEINQFPNDKQVNKVESQECFRCGKQNHSPDKKKVLPQKFRMPYLQEKGTY